MKKLILVVFLLFVIVVSGSSIIFSFQYCPKCNDTMSVTASPITLDEKTHLYNQHACNGGSDLGITIYRCTGCVIFDYLSQYIMNIPTEHRYSPNCQFKQTFTTGTLTSSKCECNRKSWDEVYKVYRKAYYCSNSNCKHYELSGDPTARKFTGITNDCKHSQPSTCKKKDMPGCLE